jgi:mRNA interferase MazF
VKTIPPPRRGDLVWLDFAPQAGHEQSGRRPALILSPEAYNRKTGLALACPITTRKKGYAFEVELSPPLAVSGVVLSDHIRSIDWQVRRAERCGTVGGEVLAEVTGKLAALLADS